MGLRSRVVSSALNRFSSERAVSVNNAFYLLEYVLLFQGKEQDLNGILRAGLPLAVADRAIAAIFAGETVRNARIPIFGRRKGLSVFEVESAIYTGFCNRMMRQWRKLAFKTNLKGQFAEMKNEHQVPSFRGRVFLY